MRTAPSPRLAGFSGVALLAALMAAAPQARADQAALVPPPANAPVPAAPAPAAPATTASANANFTGQVSAMEKRATEDAHETLHHLESNDNLTLDDLNSARQAVTRINAMIEIEKSLATLDKVRNGDHDHGHDLASAIPASALAPPMPANPAIFTPPAPVRVKHPAEPFEIARIIGSDGVYTAVLKHGARADTVRVGDVLPEDGGTVRWISASSVLIEHDGATHSLHIKNAGFYHAAP